MKNVKLEALRTYVMGLERVSADVIGMKDASARTSAVGLWEPVNVESFLASGRCIRKSSDSIDLRPQHILSLAYPCHSPTKQHVPTFLALPPHCHLLAQCLSGRSPPLAPILIFVIPLPDSAFQTSKLHLELALQHPGFGTYFLAQCILPCLFRHTHHLSPSEGHAPCGAGAPTLQSSTSAASVLLSPSRPCLHSQESLSNVVPTAVYLE
ncbi:hypothetical protein D9757_013756 [Collybiopsis confluens]|uniref:Uncharacterized protein n=1 Tax=Collybiopsis confluens TaxID=2823264 RepID=A0A8H5FX86_9AGAR|nr:hypothetical protein D9757_013756 [Collybiopsis confluens]